MKKALYLSFALIFACSNSDEQNTSLTFLQKYEGVIWDSSSGNTFLYNRVINDLNTPFEVWINAPSITDDCYNYFVSDFSNPNDNLITDINITINSEDEFEYREFGTGDFGVEQVQVFKYLVVGNTLEIEQRIFEEGQLVFTELNLQTRVEVDVDSFVLCD